MAFRCLITALLVQWCAVAGHVLRAQRAHHVCSMRVVCAEQGQLTMALPSLILAHMLYAPRLVAHTTTWSVLCMRDMRLPQPHAHAARKLAASTGTLGKAVQEALCVCVHGQSL